MHHKNSRVPCIALAAIFGMVSALGPMSAGVNAQVQPLPAGTSRVPSTPPSGQGVTPLPQRPPVGGVQPLAPADKPAGTTEILAIGTATVFNGNAAAARQAAVQAAYAEAIARGSGVAVGRLTLVKNVRAVTDIVAARSRGFVKSYDILSEGLLPGTPPRYEVRIRAMVSNETEGDPNDVESLKLFLEVIGRPTILILLPDAEVPEQNRGDWARIQAGDGVITAETSPSGPAKQPTPGLTALGGNSQVGGGMRAAESALAQAFSRYGYPVLTSDDLRANGQVTAAQLADATRGVTTAALAVAKAAGADLLLTGVLRVSTQRVAPQGVDFISATTEASAKALVVSNGYVIDAFHRTVTKAHTSTLGALSMAMDAVAQDFATTLAWKIPSILSSQPRVTKIRLDNVTLEMAQQVKARLEQLEGIDAVRFSTIPTASKSTAVLDVLSSYVVLPQDEIVTTCALAMGRACQVDTADKFELRLTVIA